MLAGRSFGLYSAMFLVIGLFIAACNSITPLPGEESGESSLSTAATGAVLAQFVPGAPCATGNGRGMAFDGTDLYYTITNNSNIFKVDVSGNCLGAIAISQSQGRIAGGPLAWDGSALWTMNYGGFSFTLYQINPADGSIQNSCNIATQNPGHPAVNNPPDSVGNFPDGLDWSGSTLWVSSEITPVPNWVVEVDTSCNILTTFNPPVIGGLGASGIAFDGTDLWHAYPITRELVQTDVSGAPTSSSFPGLSHEDLACDGTTFAVAALWANEATGGPNRITAYEIPQCFKGDQEPPVVTCEEGVNPAGKKPRAKNEDGFFELGAVDAVDPNPEIFVDAGGVLFGPFHSGTNIKYTEAPGATPSIKSGPGQVDYRITGSQDMVVIAVDASGNQSDLTCLVPPPPK